MLISSWKTRSSSTEFARLLSLIGSLGPIVGVIPVSLSQKPSGRRRR